MSDKPKTGRPDKVLKIQEQVKVLVTGKGKGKGVERWVGNDLAKVLINKKAATLVK